MKDKNAIRYQVGVVWRPVGPSSLAQGEAKRALGRRDRWCKPRRGALTKAKTPLTGLYAISPFPRAPFGRPGLMKTPLRGYSNNLSTALLSAVLEAGNTASVPRRTIT